MKQIYQQFTKVITLLLLLLAPAFVFGQTKIGGIVTDQNKQPIPGVSVRIGGTQGGTITDIDVHYFITAQPGQTITYTFVGYETTSVTVTDKTVVDVTLIGDNKTLNEIVVTAFGVKKETRVIGYAT